ncbi:hypothetical protein NIES2101_13090 [Calothrix sp. HK-06]|nr:hypothetical protein NIES2101_13090 [Calothrix sp. HK-06]
MSKLKGETLAVQKTNQKNREQLAEPNTIISTTDIPGNFNVQNIINKAYEEALRERGHANILIAGGTGVGKSTLINAVFQGDFATTGQGRPVTQNTREIKKPGIPLSIFDTRGLEMANFNETFKALRQCISSRKTTDPNQHIHVAWVCISEESRRVESAVEQLVQILHEYNIPVIVVITKAISDRDFKNKVLDILPSALNVIRVNSIATKLDNGTLIEPSGLKELVDLTMQVIPEGQKSAFAASQKVDLEQKKNRCHKIVAGATTLAAGVGFSPVPFSDYVLLVPIQVGMLAGISATFGLSIDEGFLSTIVASTITGTIGTVTGKTIAANLLKFVPVIGSTAGGLMQASVAVAITTAFGESYIATLAALFGNNNGKPPTNQEVLEAFQKRNQSTQH